MTTVNHGGKNQRLVKNLGNEHMDHKDKDPSFSPSPPPPMMKFFFPINKLHQRDSKVRDNKHNDISELPKVSALSF